MKSYGRQQHNLNCGDVVEIPKISSELLEASIYYSMGTLCAMPPPSEGCSCRRLSRLELCTIVEAVA